MLVKAHAEQKKMVVAWGAQCRATHRDVSHLNSQQEEADTFNISSPCKSCDLIMFKKDQGRRPCLLCGIHDHVTLITG